MTPPPIATLPPGQFAVMARRNRSEATGVGRATDDLVAGQRAVGTVGPAGPWHPLDCPGSPAPPGAPGLPGSLDRPAGPDGTRVDPRRAVPDVEIAGRRHDVRVPGSRPDRADRAAVATEPSICTPAPGSPLTPCGPCDPVAPVKPCGAPGAVRACRPSRPGPVAPAAPRAPANPRGPRSPFNEATARAERSFGRIVRSSMSTRLDRAVLDPRAGDERLHLAAGGRRDAECHGKHGNQNQSLLHVVPLSPVAQHFHCADRDQRPSHRRLQLAFRGVQPDWLFLGSGCSSTMRAGCVRPARSG